MSICSGFFMPTSKRIVFYCTFIIIFLSHCFIKAVLLQVVLSKRIAFKKNHKCDPNSTTTPGQSRPRSNCIVDISPHPWYPELWILHHVLSPTERVLSKEEHIQVWHKTTFLKHVVPIQNVNLLQLTLVSKDIYNVWDRVIKIGVPSGYQILEQ